MAPSPASWRTDAGNGSHSFHACRLVDRPTAGSSACAVEILAGRHHGLKIDPNSSLLRMKDGGHHGLLS